MKHRMKSCLVIASLLVLPGCPKKPTGPVSSPIPGLGKKDYTRPLPPGQWALRKIDAPRDLPDFTAALADRNQLREAIARSLNFLSKPSTPKYFPQGHPDFTHARAVRTLQAINMLLDSGRDTATLNRLIRSNFDVYMSVGWDGMGTVLYTSYYTPIFNASRKRDLRFGHALYQKPDDLVKDADGQVLGRLLPDGNIVKYPSRTELEASGKLKGLELVYLADEFEVYIAQVQGSARLRLTDGKLITVGYTATNGHDYKSIAMMMVRDGKITKDQLSLRAMIDYFKRHPDEVKTYVSKNPRYVFFGESDQLPHGSINEPITPLRSIATDKQIYPRACLAFVDTQLPFGRRGNIGIRPYQGFALDQDSGGAIRAPGRCDFYRGIGDEAGELAGRTYQEGKLYYLCIKPDSPLMSSPPPGMP